MSYGSVSRPLYPTYARLNVEHMHSLQPITQRSYNGLFHASSSDMRRIPKRIVSGTPHRVAFSIPIMLPSSNT
jgi:hypothetical protein